MRCIIIKGDRYKNLVLILDAILIYTDSVYLLKICAKGEKEILQPV